MSVAKERERNVELTEADLVLAQHREVREYVEFGMYEYIDHEHFDQLSAQDLLIYQILARKKQTDRFREIRPMIVSDTDALARVTWEIEQQEMVSIELVQEVLPPAGDELLPIFLGDQQTMAEVDWYIHHGLPDLLNKLNSPALKTISKEDFDRLVQEAEKQNIILGNDSLKSKYLGLGTNGTKEVK